MISGSVMLQVRRGIMRWQREDDERSWEMRLPKGEIKGLKRFEKSRADIIRCAKHLFRHAGC